MQPTNVQVQRTLAALEVAPGHPGSSREPIARDELEVALRGLPDGLLEGLGQGPALRPDVLAQARDRLARGQSPSNDELATRMVGRMVCDRLR